MSQFGDGRLASADIAAEIAVMTATDQQVMREAGRTILTDTVVDHQVWPGWADRDQITEQVHRYADDTQEHHADITTRTTRDLTDTDRDRLGVGDDLAARIQRLAGARAGLLATAAAAAKGRTAVERHHLTAVVHDIDAGTIDGDAEFPELMWVDERTKAALDEHRGHAHGQRICAESRKEVTHLLSGAGIDLAHHDALRSTVAAVENTLHHVAGGSPRGVEADRKQFLDNRTQLGRALQHTGVDGEAMTGIREVIDRHAHTAGQAGRSAIERRDRWHERIDRIVAARDDAAAQRRAATAGQPVGPGRACTAGPAVTGHSSGAGHSPRIRHLHDEEIGR